MGHYGDLYQAAEDARFLNHWVPETQEELGLELTWEQLRFTLAHRRAAESELKALKAALKTIKASIDV